MKGKRLIYIFSFFALIQPAMGSAYEPLKLGEVRAKITFNFGLGYYNGYSFTNHFVDTFPSNAFSKKLPCILGGGLGFGFKRIRLESQFEHIFPLQLTENYMMTNNYYCVSTALGIDLIDTVNNYQITPYLGHKYIKEVLYYNYVPNFGEEGEPLILWEGKRTGSNVIFGGQITIYELFNNTISFETNLNYSNINYHSYQGHLLLVYEDTPKIFNGVKFGMGPYFCFSRGKVKYLTLVLKLNL